MQTSKIIQRGLISLNAVLRFHSEVSKKFLCTAAQIPSVEVDSKLVRRGDFRGVSSGKEKVRSSNPDVVLSKMQEQIRKNYRVSGETILFDVVRQLEVGNEELKEHIFRSPERWIPLLISSCGHPLSNIDNSAKLEILDRLWAQLAAKMSPMPDYAWDARLRVLNENGAEWDPLKELDNMERSGVEPTIQTFHAVVEKIASSGDVDGCRNMVYNMARKGFPVDEHINAASVFVFAIRGHYKKADSLCEQSATKYGERGSQLAHGAAVRAAACRGDTDRLRQMLRKCVVVSTKKLSLSSDDIFDTIWHMAEKSRDGRGAECSELVEQMLNCTNREFGFFRRLVREIERHICHRHYYTALSLLEDTKRLSDCLENQRKNTFLHEIIGRLSTQLIRNQEPAHLIRDLANRIHFAYKSGKQPQIRMYDDLLYATLMLKDMELDDRFQYFRSFIDEIDARRERVHIALPLLMSEKTLDQRLAVMYRLTRVGYRSWSTIDIEPLASSILQPLYDKGRPVRDLSRLDKMARILKSYGIPDRQTWLVLHNWSKMKAKEERKPEDQWKAPYGRNLRGWCRAHYEKTFEQAQTAAAKKPVHIPYEKLKSCVDQGDISKVVSILTSSGWPSDTKFEEIVPSTVNLYLMHESWKNTEKMLEELATFAHEWDEDGEKTPLKNYHLLKMLRRVAEEESTTSIRQITDYAYELRTLFPHAVSHYNGFFETQFEYKKLFAKCFDRFGRHGLATSTVDELIEFLRCLVKLDLIMLHPSETITPYFMKIILSRAGWNEALNTWQKFLSSLHCPNGTIALLRHCLYLNTDESRKNIQFIIHRGSTFMSQSRISAMHIAVLISMRHFEDAEKACDAMTVKIEPNDLVMVMRLVNALKTRSYNDQFMLDFAALCLRKLRLADDRDAAQNMLADLLRICDNGHMGPTALRVYDLFSEYGVELREEEKNRLATAIEKHSSLSTKWIFKPDGFLNISAADDIITQSEEARIEQKLKKSVSTPV